MRGKLMKNKWTNAVRAVYGQFCGESWTRNTSRSSPHRHEKPISWPKPQQIVVLLLVVERFMLVAGDDGSVRIRT